MNVQSGDVVENKVPDSRIQELSGNVIENKGGYALKSGNVVEKKGVEFWRILTAE